MPAGLDVDEPATGLLSAVEYILSLPQDMRNPTHRKPGYSQTSRDKKQEQEDALWEEVGDKVYQVKLDWVRKLYCDLATDDQVAEYLKTPASGYDAKTNRWEVLPDTPAEETELIPPLTEIVTRIIAHFYPSFEPGVSRSAVDSHNLRLAHDNGKHASHPEISIKATGPSFEAPQALEQSGGLGYTNIAAVINARTDKEKGDRLKQAAQLAIYCRQIFFQQPNRHYARSLMVTENHVRLVHYDRSGVYVSPLVDIHKEKEIFVRLILGISSPNEKVLGLDTSVQWVIDDVTGKKVSGTVKVDERDSENETSSTVTYDLNMEEPPLVRPSIRGRGTVGWHATHPVTHESVLIKDAWRTDTRTSEVEHLRMALGLPGVVEMLAYQDFCAQTCEYRPPKWTPPGFYNRIKLRVVMKKYGASIWYFKNRLDFLRAFLDAFVGHKKLFDRGILHRDISVQNILFGPPDAPQGNLGRLIDLDVAVRTANGISTVPSTPLTGTRLYQSVSVLRGLDIKPPPPQDYTDDLEAFFYVLCHIIFLFVAPGQQTAQAPSFLRHWSSDEEFTLLASLKVGFMLCPLPLKQLPSYWGAPFKALLKGFQKVVVKILERKADIREDGHTNDEQKREAYTELAGDVDAYFDEVKGALVQTITQLEQEGLNAEEARLQPGPHRAAAPLSSRLTAPAAHPDPVESVGETSMHSQIEAIPPPRKKRPSEGAEEGGTPNKRSRSNVPKSVGSSTSSVAKSEREGGDVLVGPTNSGSA